MNPLPELNIFEETTPCSYCNICTTISESPLDQQLDEAADGADNHGGSKKQRRWHKNTNPHRERTAGNEV